MSKSLAGVESRKISLSREGAVSVARKPHWQKNGLQKIFSEEDPDLSTKEYCRLLNSW
jgi:hypothetical protein